MKNRIAQIKSRLKENPQDILIPVAFGAATLVGAATMFYSLKVAGRNDIVVPANVINHMKKSGNGILGANAIDGYDILVKLIPVKS